MKLKKIISFILIACFAFGAIPFASFATGSSETVIFNSASSVDAIKVFDANILKGDIDGDDKIAAKDLRALKRIIVGDSFTASRLAIDIDGDGKVTAKDAARMKKTIAGLIQPEYYGNAVITKNYDAEEGAASLTVNEVNTTGAFFDVSLSGRTAKYVAFVMKGAEAFDVSVVDTSNLQTDVLSYDTVTGNNYNAYIAQLPVYSDIHSLEVTYDDAPAQGKTIFVDSVMFADTLSEVKALAAERVNARAISDPEEFKYFTVKFDSASQASRVISKNNTSASYDAGYNALKLQVSGSSADPWALVNLEDLGISADEYKYIVYNSMIPSGCHQPTPEGELFYSAGSITQPTGGYSNIYSQFSDSQFHSTIFEMTNAAFWTGTVHSLRFDYYCACAVGDSQYVRSVTFCNSYRAAAAICTDRVTPAADIKSIFYYGKYDDGSFKLSYRMYVPYDYDGVKEYPFLMLLHGAGERGTDGTYHLQGGFPYLFNDTTKSSFKNIVFAPQCPKDMKWVDCDWTYGSYNLNNTPESKPLGAAMNVVYKAFQNYKIDRDRVYVSGLSMGGYGSWDVLTRHGDIFSAGVILCGGGDPTQALRLVNIPIRAFHGTADNIVPSRGSKQMYDAIVAAGGTKCSYTALGGYDHMIWDYVYQLQWVFDWLYQQRISDR